ncbi:TPA: ADP-ribosyltransferase [Yersinia enterocolitica]|nr:hypothetical protein [Yersinia enterocolitica]HDL8521998.1 hypothetical protein [Yersinia enterocolitica]
MRINPILLISILTFISIKTSHSREAEPKHHFNKESFSQYQARHCKWETGYTCKDVPKDQGMPPPRTSEEIALEVGLGLLAGGPTPQPKGFKFSIGKLPIKTTAKVPATPKPGTITERTPLLSTTAKPKAKGTIRRVNGKIGYLLGDPEAPQLGEEPPIKRVRVVESESESESSSIKESGAEESSSQKSETSKFTVIHRRAIIQESEVATAIEEMESIYGKEFWLDTQLDINDEIEGYNQLSNHEKISFQDYFALRDYSEDGYVRINNAMRSKSLSRKIQIEIEQLNNALKRHSDINISLRNRSFKNLNIDNTDIVYRGEVRNRAEFEAEIEEEEIYNNETFFSTTSDEDDITDFITDNLKEGEVNVRYTIHYPKGMTYSADVSALLENNEGTRIFIPHSVFLVTEIKVIDNETVEVEMRALGGLLSDLATLPMPRF